VTDASPPYTLEPTLSVPRASVAGVLPSRSEVRLTITHHPRQRATFRSIRLTDVQWVLDHADCLLHRPGGAQAMSVSREALAEAVGAGADPELLGRVASLTFILYHNDVVTAYRRERRHRDGRGRSRWSSRSR